MNVALYKKGTDKIFWFSKDVVESAVEGKPNKRSFFGDRTLFSIDITNMEIVWTNDVITPIFSVAKKGRLGGKIIAWNKTPDQLRACPIYKAGESMALPCGTREDVNQATKKAIRGTYSSEDEFKNYRKGVENKADADFVKMKAFIEKIVEEGNVFKNKHFPKTGE